MRKYRAIFAAFCLVGQWPQPSWAQTRIILGGAVEAAPGGGATSAIAAPGSFNAEGSRVWLPRETGRLVLPDLRLVLPETASSHDLTIARAVPARAELIGTGQPQSLPVPQRRIILPNEAGAARLRKISPLDGLTRFGQDLLAAGAKPEEIDRDAALLERFYSGSPLSNQSVTRASPRANPPEAGPAGKPPLDRASFVDGHIAGYAHIPLPRLANPWIAVGVVGALTALATAAMTRLSLPRDGWVGISGWLGSAILIAFPLVHIVEIYREMKALKHGGEEAAIARAHLGGVSGDLHIMLKAGKLLKYPGIYASASPTLMVNTITRTFLSWTVLAMLAKTGNLAKAKFAIVTVAAASLVGITPLIAANHTLVTSLGVLGAIIYGLFTLPQYRLNYEALLKLRSVDPNVALGSFQRLRGNSALFLTLIIIGKILIIPTYIATDLLYNASSNLFSGLVTLLILLQMGKVRMLPWQKRPGL